tara:strand:- start:4642 stop:4767 length:126 start_codon:yes stop_codon:yes gene_type:complete
MDWQDVEAKLVFNELCGCGCTLPFGPVSIAAQAQDDRVDGI